MREPDYPPTERPACAQCGYPMARAELIPGLSQIAARTFVCRHCGNIDLIAARKAAGSPRDDALARKC